MTRRILDVHTDSAGGRRGLLRKARNTILLRGVPYIKRGIKYGDAWSLSGRMDCLGRWGGEADKINVQAGFEGFNTDRRVE